MANLFFIHTPMQLWVAQQVIRQEQLKDNYALYGYIANNAQFLDAYDLITIDGVWKKWIPFPGIANWASLSRKHLFRDSLRTLRFWRHILSIIREYRIDSVFLGDMKNISCHLAAMALNIRNISICFFEEGAGHYIMNYGYGKKGSFGDKLYSVFIDAFYYLPFFYVHFGYVHYWKGFTLNDLPITVRYSIIPYYHELFDRQLFVSSQLSSKLKSYLSKEISQINPLSNNILLLTSPIYEICNDDGIIYIETILDYVSSINNPSILLYIKFHPRESEKVRSKIVEELIKSGVRYCILGERVNLPVELYLQFVKFTYITMFFCSTAIYNGYLFPKTSFFSLLDMYRQKCELQGKKCIKSLDFLIDEARLFLKTSILENDEIKGLFIK